MLALTASALGQASIRDAVERNERLLGLLQYSRGVLRGFALLPGQAGCEQKEARGEAGKFGRRHA